MCMEGVKWDFGNRQTLNLHLLISLAVQQNTTSYIT